MATVDAPARRASVGALLTVRPSRGGGGRIAVRWPWTVVAAAVAWGLVSLRAETVAVPYLNDSSMHEQMVRFATAQLRAGHLPLLSWFPYLGEGSPQFLHYQSLPAMVTGAIGLVIGPDVAFRWTLYLLLALWPVSVYLAARLFGGSRVAAAGAAAMAPFLVSVPGVGYEQHAYVWIGYGVWTQLWAMWTLPLAWGCSWSAIRHGRHRLGAVVFVALTCACHFETGYLAIVPLIVWPFVAWRPLRRHLARAALVIVGSLLAAAWVFIPLLAQRDWAATNEILHGTALENGYGAHQVLEWLFLGGLLDHGRLPVVTVFMVIGLAVAWIRWAEDPSGRALIVALAVCLLLSFGRATFGSLIAIVPGSADLFFRRFMAGIQLAALLLAGRGAADVARALRLAPALWRPTGRARRPDRSWRPGARGAALAGAGLLAAAVVLYPAWHQLDRFDSRNAAAIDQQRAADHAQGAELQRLTAVVKAAGGGRTYAGMPSNWGPLFTVGQVPVFKYLESQDVDEVGYTLRTASLMTDPEYYFDDGDPSDYRLFGVRYEILPVGRSPSVGARLVKRAGAYMLWRIAGNGYVSAARVIGTIVADRSDVGAHSIALLHSGLAARGDELAVHWGARGAAPDRLPAAPPGSSPGRVAAQAADLTAGRAGATLAMRTAGVAVLGASFDPGWRATVNGHAVATRMIAPALVGVDVPAGIDHVRFEYQGYGGYPWLLGLAGLTLLAVAWGPAAGRRARRRRGAQAGV